MSSSKHISVCIQPLNYGDIIACAQLSASAFAVDPHTIVKNLGDEPCDMYDVIRTMLLGCLELRTHIYVKAVDQATGKIVGHAGWAFKGVEETLIPWSAPADDKSAAHQDQPERCNVSTKMSNNDCHDENRQDSIHLLKELEARDMHLWQSEIVPKNKACIFITSLHVSISHQSLGVGSALIQHGNALADQLRLPIWVHSSHQAFEAYRKFGFEVVRELDIDLDEWAPRGPREGEAVMGNKENGKWGRYVIRYMKRCPKMFAPSMEQTTTPIPSSRYKTS
ncbi:hypothetical protein CDD81_2381 [Ophiocordyceps australis]|uniref:N-acetyltransferase domain-containing protein n=1 Tax=Ophiocordyceps australis TaxID=1399860 RepID=A0A2C5XY97_9HYPO|nr:hypothetical protein CDD81_2381 [Ophiocordyceps australis]